MSAISLRCELEAGGADFDAVVARHEKFLEALATQQPAARWCPSSASLCVTKRRKLRAADLREELQLPSEDHVYDLFHCYQQHKLTQQWHRSEINTRELDEEDVASFDLYDQMIQSLSTPAEGGSTSTASSQAAPAQIITSSTGATINKSRIIQQNQQRELHSLAPEEYHRQLLQELRYFLHAERVAVLQTFALLVGEFANISTAASAKAARTSGTSSSSSSSSSRLRASVNNNSS
ncbi:unnamed protein product, partial [Amoebophrya sp. A120]|eukprot:GSA120T00001571001.1